MFGVYGRGLLESRYGRHGYGSPRKLGHDNVNYMHPGINYDKPARKIRPQKRKEYDSDRELDTIPRRCFCSSMYVLNGEHDENCSLYENNNTDPSTLTQGAEMLSRMFTCLAVEEQAEFQK